MCFNAVVTESISSFSLWPKRADIGDFRVMLNVLIRFHAT